MTGPLPSPVIRRRGKRALRRMSRRQRAIFLALRFEQVGYAELAARHGMTSAEVQAHFAAALRIFLRSLREPDPWWRRAWDWLWPW